MTSLVGTLATKLVQLKPYDPESKGIVERANRFMETSFLPGRTFESPVDFNDQLGAWLPIANGRTVRAIGGRPVDLLSVDASAMLPMPPVAPNIETITQVRLGRDYYVRVAGNDYSVDPSAIGNQVDVHAGLATVTVTRGARRLATHDRVWAKGRTLTDPIHVQVAAALRQQFQQSATTVEPPVRDLADYDRAFGVEFDSNTTGSDPEVA